MTRLNRVAPVLRAVRQPAGGRSARFGFLVLLGVAVACVFPLMPQPDQFRDISLDGLRGKMEGGWAGQMIGASFGAPTEFWYRGKRIERDLPAWKPELVEEALDQDDLYVNMALAKVLDDRGVDATAEDLGGLFKNARYGLWGANLAAHDALRRGVPAALSGTPRTFTPMTSISGRNAVSWA
jgi:hypothetical protein